MEPCRAHLCIALPPGPRRPIARSLRRNGQDQHRSWAGRCTTRAPARTAAIPVGFEPTTTSLEGRCSIQLSYGTGSCKGGERRLAGRRAPPFDSGSPKEPGRAIPVGSGPTGRMLGPSELRDRKPATAHRARAHGRMARPIAKTSGFVRERLGNAPAAPQCRAGSRRHRKTKGQPSVDPSSCRGGQIRTDDLLVPNQARYRATLRPERGAKEREKRLGHPPRGAKPSTPMLRKGAEEPEDDAAVDASAATGRRPAPPPQADLPSPTRRASRRRSDPWLLHARARSFRGARPGRHQATSRPSCAGGPPLGRPHPPCGPAGPVDRQRIPFGEASSRARSAGWCSSRSARPSKLVPLPGTNTPRCRGAAWRRGRDSNPRYSLTRTAV